MVHSIQYIVTFEFAWLLILVQMSNGLNLGLISGDLKRTSSPLIIRKTSHHSPVTINIKPGLSRLPVIIPPLSTPILPKKSSPVKIKKNRLLTKPLRLRKLSKLPKLPKIPKLPILPLLSPLLPLKIPKLPILPLLPILPPFPPRLTKILKPLRIPILSKPGLKALGSEIKPVRVPVPNFKKHIMEKLLKLRKNGSLTTSELIRFKKMLLQ